MNTTIKDLNQRSTEIRENQFQKSSSEQYPTKLIFMGIVFLALSCWLMLVDHLMPSIQSSAYAGAAVIFMASINYLNTDIKPNKND